jgi:hypothetical protein
MVGSGLWVGISGLAGALLSQLISAASVFWNENRKDKREQRNSYREKKLEIGENFYFMNGERMDLIKKNIQYWKSKNVDMSQASRRHLNENMNKLIGHMDKINAENWKYNLINLYFKVKLNSEIVHRLNTKSHSFLIKATDISEQIENAAPELLEGLYQQHALTIFNMCAHYERIYEALDADMHTVKMQLLAEFGNTPVS